MVKLFLFLESLLLLAQVRLSLSLVPVSTLRASVRVSQRRRSDPKRLAWAINRAARFVPRSTCLVRALAAQKLLARHGHESKLHLGVAKSPNFQAHAWLDYKGHTLVGAAEGYTALPT